MFFTTTDSLLTPWPQAQTPPCLIHQSPAMTRAHAVTLTIWTLLHPRRAHHE